MKSYHISKYLKYVFSCLMLLAVILQQSSCEKYLDVKPDKTLVTPATIQDLQGILDYPRYMNLRYSEAGDIASDNYYLTDRDFLALPSDYARNGYLWKAPAFRPGTNDWEMLYVIVYNANIVMEDIATVQRNSTNSVAWDNCKGSALLFRGRAFYEAAQLWAKAYDSTTARTDLGIPLRLTSNFNIPTTRATVQETYSQIISDLKAAILLLQNTSAYAYRPSKAAAYGFLARTYLAMRNYDKALLYSDSCLQITHTLYDYNNLDSTTAYPFANIQFTNPENIMYSAGASIYENLYYRYSKVDTSLYVAYDSNDLRKTIFFKANTDGSFYFRGSYTGNSNNYDGLATDEMLLTRAECYAREGDVKDALNDLNALLVKRWKRGTFIPFTASTASAALQLILVERRKELINRLLRFTDIKRLNKEGANIIQKRIIQGKTYILPPDDPRYALPIPDNVINYTHIQQN